MSAFKNIVLNADSTSPAVAVGMSGWSINWSGIPFQNIPSITLGISGTNGELVVTNTGGFKAFLDASLLTANRSFKFPDTPGTLSVGGGGSSPWLIKDTTYTAVSNDRIQADTSGGGFTINLPETATAGDSIQIEDPLGTWNGSPLTVGRNGLKINGGTSDYTGNLDGAKLSIVYIDATTGWSIK